MEPVTHPLPLPMIHPRLKRAYTTHDSGDGSLVRQSRRKSIFKLAVLGTRVSCYKLVMEIKLTAVFRKFPEGYAAFVEELPGANTQGATLEEAARKFERSGRDGFAGQP